MTNPDDPIYAMPQMAFPPEFQDKVLKLHEMYGGLTKREWFAGMALQGLLANQGIMEGMSLAGSSDIEMVAKGIAAMAKGHADALLAELNKKP